MGDVLIRGCIRAGFLDFTCLSTGDATLEGLADDDEDETHFTRSAQFIFGERDENIPQ